MSVVFPSITAVIPTIGRPSLRTAVESATRQIGVEVEIQVVLDRPEALKSVTALLQGIDVNVLVTEGKKGGAFARNLGLQAATTEYVAFLDDDDEWEESKSQEQISLISAASRPERTIALASTLFVSKNRGSVNHRVMPKRVYKREETNIGNYLVCRHDLRYGRNFMQTSSLLARTALLKEFPWNPKLEKHQDWNLFMRLLGPQANIDLVTVVRPLVRVMQDSVSSVSGTPNWEASLKWLDLHSHELSNRAQLDFIWTQIIRSAIRQRSIHGLISGSKRFPPGVPHFWAVVVGLSGILRR